MKIFGWWKRKKIQKEVKTQAPKAENDICPECGGRGYNISNYSEPPYSKMKSG